MLEIMNRYGGQKKDVEKDKNPKKDQVRILKYLNLDAQFSVLVLRVCKQNFKCPFI